MDVVLRPARVGDADALTRLHVEAGLGTAAGPAWTTTHGRDLARRLAAADPSLIAYVVEHPVRHELVCAAVGFVQVTLSRPDNPWGRTAHLSSLATRPAFRRRGYARAASQAWLAEAAQRQCATVTLSATDAGAGLYLALGFQPQPNAMRLSLPARPAIRGIHEAEPNP